MSKSRHERLTLSAIGMIAVIGLAGCDKKSSPTTPGEPPLSGLIECNANNFFHKNKFSSRSAVLDNKWYPLSPGTQIVYDGQSDRGGGLLPHRVVLTVTDLTKMIGGVRAAVIWDRDYNNGVLQEAELAFLAQDKEGNIWTMGEYPEEYQNGVFVGAPSVWFGTLAGAEPGILVPNNKPIGTRFSQGFAPDVNFLDCAFVSAYEQSICTLENCYENVMIVTENSPLEVGTGSQFKYYAAGIGNVFIAPSKDDPEGEYLVVTQRLQLSPAALADVREQALELERHAYQTHPLYRLTSPCQ
jgi:hypothetical protein